MNERNEMLRTGLLRGLCRAAIVVAMLAGTHGAAEASAPPPPVEKPAPVKKGPPPGLTGNTVPQCDAGKYPAGGFCRPSPPDFYVPSGATYPVACPPGSKAPAGSRSAAACIGPEPKKDEKKEEKKGGH